MLTKYEVSCSDHLDVIKILPVHVIPVKFRKWTFFSSLFTDLHIKNRLSDHCNIINLATGWGALGGYQNRF